MSKKGVRDRRSMFYLVTLACIALLSIVGIFRPSFYLFFGGTVLYLMFFIIAVFVQKSALFVPIFLPDPSVGSIVALTFDDGPHPINTPKVLDILENYHVKATFFCVGKNVEKYPQLIERINRAGHQVANHTYSHPTFINFYSRKRLKEEMLKGQDVIDSIIHKRPTFFRQVAGIVNPQLGEIVESMGFVLVGWDVRPGDIRKKRPDRIVDKAVMGVRNGSIILLHDGTEPEIGGREAILSETLPAIIEGIRNRGFKFVTIEELYAQYKDI